MGFAKFARALRADGMMALLLRTLFRWRILSWEEIGALAERIGYDARLDGVIIHMDNPFITTHFKGRIIMGQYEEYERQIIDTYLPLDEPVVELGASIGVVACSVNRRLKAPDRHVVVEANLDLISTLKKNRELNHSQFDIVEAAIGYDSPSVTFYANGLSLLGSIYYGGYGGDRKMEVATVSLQAIAEKAGFERFNVISDIEGSEIELIKHEIDFIREHVGFIMMETHEDTPYGEEGVNLVVETLKQNGFEIVDSIRNQYCFRKKG